MKKLFTAVVSLLPVLCTSAWASQTVTGEHAFPPASKRYSKVESGGAFPTPPFRFAIARTVAIGGCSSCHFNGTGRTSPGQKDFWGN
jgi:hypothetical protein